MNYSLNFCQLAPFRSQILMFHVEIVLILVRICRRRFIEVFYCCVSEPQQMVNDGVLLVAVANGKNCNIMRCARSGIINIHKSIFYGFELWNDPNYIRFDWTYEYTQTQPETDRRDIDSTTWIETERGREKNRKRESVVCTKNKENYSLKIMQLITKMCFDSILARLYYIAHRTPSYRSIRTKYNDRAYVVIDELLLLGFLFTHDFHSSWRFYVYFWCLNRAMHFRADDDDDEMMLWLQCVDLTYQISKISHHSTHNTRML